MWSEKSGGKRILFMSGGVVIGWGELAELGEGGGDDAQGKLNIRGSGVPAEAKAQDSGSCFGGEADGGKHVRWLDCTRGTGGSGRASKTFQVERNEEGFALDARKNQIRRVGGSWSGAAVYTRLGNAVQQTLLQFVAKSRFAPRVIRQRLASDFRGLAEAHDARDVLRPGTEAALVMSAIEKLPQARSTADIQGADSLWRIEFVPGNGEEINSQSVDVDRDFPRGLYGVGVEVDVGFLGDAADFFDRLDGAELVVGVHDGGQKGFRPDGAGQILEINLSFASSRKI